MREYNLYYNGKKINKMPLTIDDVNEIKSRSVIRHIEGRHSQDIPVSGIRIIERIVF